MPPLPSAPEPLLLVDRNQLVVRPKNRNPLEVDDPAVLEKHRFKSKPDSERERSDCRLPLTGPHLSRISACRDLEFGQVPPGTEVVRYFTVTNSLPSSIWVKLMTEEHLELKTSGPLLAQVIPSDATAVFDVRLVGRELGRLERQLTYTINGQTMRVRVEEEEEEDAKASRSRWLTSPLALPGFELQCRIFGEIVPRRLNSSADRLIFRFEPTFWDPSITLPLVLENPLAVAAPFRAEPSSKAYVVEPVTGEVPAKVRSN